VKVAVINFSGNVGKTTVARHLLAPRIAGAKVIAVESINADEGQDSSLRGREFGDLQEYLQTVSHAVVDIGASNVEDLLGLMHKYRGSHEDFDCFVVPVVPALKQQQDTLATLAELARIGVPPDRLRLVFNQMQDDTEIDETFEALLAFIRQNPIVSMRPACRLGVNEIHQRIRGSQVDLSDWHATRPTSRRTSGTRTTSTRRWPGRRSSRPIACGVLPELDECFAALELT
jgi:hypothetical protein